MLSNLTKTPPVPRLTSPCRLEVRRGASLVFADKPVFGVNITLRQDLPQLCARHCLPGEVIGWVDHNQLDHFRLGRQDDLNRVEDFFDASSQQIVVRQPMHIIMTACTATEAKQDFVLLFCSTTQ